MELRFSFGKKKKRRKVYGMSDGNKWVKKGRPEGRQPGGEDRVFKGAVFIREEQCARRTLGRKDSRQRASRYKAVEIVSFLLAGEDFNLSACPFLFFTKFFKFFKCLAQTFFKPKSIIM